LPQVLAAIQSLGFEAEVRDTSAAAPASAQDATPTKWWPLAIAGTSAVLAEVVYWGHAKIRPIRYHKPASYVEVCMHASWL